MSKYFRYPTVILDSKFYFIIIGNGHCHTGVTKVFKIPLSDFDSEVVLQDLTADQVINYTKHFVHHNFTAFQNKDGDKYLAIGGMFRNKDPFKDKSRLDGLQLYVSSNLINWKYKYSVLTDKNFPEKFTKSIEKTLPEFDSNLCSFYSRILGKYILIGRANIARGVRSMQVTTTSDFKEWTDFELFKINSFSKGNNYYMFRCIELEQAGLFFGLGVFTDKPSHPTEIQIKKLVSKDLISWTDYGKLCDCSLPLFVKKGSFKSNVHVAGIVINNTCLEIFLHLNCFLPESSIKKYCLEFDPNGDILSQIKDFSFEI